MATRTTPRYQGELALHGFDTSLVREGPFWVECVAYRSDDRRSMEVFRAVG